MIWFFVLIQVSVPCTSLFKTVTVRCGHCTNLLPVNMRGLLLPSANQFHLGHSFFSPSHNLLVHDDETNLMPQKKRLIWDSDIIEIDFDKFIWCSSLMIVLQEEIPNPSPNFLINQNNGSDFTMPARGGVGELPRPPAINRRKTHYIFSIFKSFETQLSVWRNFLETIHLGQIDCSLPYIFTKFFFDIFNIQFSFMDQKEELGSCEFLFYSSKYLLFFPTLDVLLPF